jgi:hypothetical protein
MTPQEEKQLFEFNKAAEKTYPYPDGRFSGRGIVICGGDKYFPCLWVCLQMLKKVGCALPIELWHFENEITADQQELLDLLSVQCVNATEKRKEYPARILNGWELKAYAILHSSFEEVLLLDADNMPVRNPDFLFSCEQFKETGAIFWPDFNMLAESRAIWKLTGVAYQKEPEFESGQIVVDKKRCWAALNLTMYLNEHSDFFYKHIHGDKETFHFAWRKLGQKYAMPSKRVGDLGGYCMLQHDFEGRRLFQHRNNNKWNFGFNPTHPDFMFEKDCRQSLSQLLQHLTAKQQERFNPAERLLATKVIEQRLYSYIRVFYDKRTLEFLPNGLIGAGSARLESRWTVVQNRFGLYLQILGEGGLTCNLREDSEGIFQGEWTKFEKMPVQLHPEKIV